jgi:hypothetical protein
MARRRLTFNGLQGVMSRKIESLIRTSNPTIKELLDASFYMRSVLYETKLGD